MGVGSASGVGVGVKRVPSVRHLRVILRARSSSATLRGVTPILGFGAPRALKKAPVGWLMIVLVLAIPLARHLAIRIQATAHEVVMAPWGLIPPSSSLGVCKSSEEPPMMLGIYVLRQTLEYKWLNQRVNPEE